jgi:signal transduction histidine kinase
MRFSLRTKIFTSLLMLVLGSFVLTGLITYGYFKRETERVNREQMLRTRVAINSLVDYMLKNEMARFRGEQLATVMYDHICELAAMNQVDINIYDLEGHNLISSNPQPVEAGLYPRQLEDQVLTELKSSNEKVIIRKPNLPGDFYYAYGLLDDGKGGSAAIIGLPFQVDDVSHKDELREYLSELGVYYFFLLALAAVIAYVLTARLLRPIHHLVSEMRRIRLTRKSARLPITGQDEIAQLIREYNHMLGELERNAEALARSEREEAWREMSRQVAHEIKNPLTPMRLHLQNLLEGPGLHQPERVAAVLTLLMEQVDSLTEIAGAFSEFARMPDPQRKPVPIQKLIQSAKDLFEGQGVETQECPADWQVMGDQHQLLRALQNLVKNALQAIPASREPRVHLSAALEGKHMVLRVMDNGSGIPEGERDRIFEPHFTTKTSGMGLGLGIVKAIAEAGGGAVQLEQTGPEGTTFALILPVLNPSMTT